MNPPWHEDALARLLAARATLHHALLIEGVPGIGKRDFARTLAQALLCEAPDGQGRACGTCRGCAWFGQGSHPDFRWLRPESEDPDFQPTRERKPSRQIRIEQVRSLAGFVHTGAHRGGRKVVLVEPAEAMNVGAANALLKTLEEPPGDTVFLLVCGRPGALPATVRSRCRRVVLGLPPAGLAGDWLAARAGIDTDTARTWLAAAGGAPLLALQRAEPAATAAHRAVLETLAGLPDIAVAAAAESLSRHDAGTWLPVLHAWTTDLARVLAGAEPRFLPGERQHLEALARRTSLGRILALEAAVGAGIAAAAQPLNARLLAEGIVLRCCEAFAS